MLFFAGLAETLGRREVDLDYPGQVDVAGVWDRVVGAPRPDRLRCARNQVHCDFGAAVQDGDEVAFFPPVTGG
ncbi:MAG TPA: molybdopterin synthase sulfur carrier subunit [Gammaproteobacteria bacterium]|nr:molybdopterin synthase sulfur carrier subunit [Gammaproteobacteria bacterium]